MTRSSKPVLRRHRSTWDEYTNDVLDTFQIKSLSQIRWAHAVNNQRRLKEALRDPMIHFIEADIGYGWYQKGSIKGCTKSSMEVQDRTELDLIMAHFPTTQTSDLYFHEFIDSIRRHNREILDKQKSGESRNDFFAEIIKGVKLDFKHFEAVEKCLKYLRRIPPEELPHCWLNADIVMGPSSVALGKPLPAVEFVQLCVKHVPNAVLSLGWSLGISLQRNFDESMIADMVEVCMFPNYSTANSEVGAKVAALALCRHVTFAVCAWYALKSTDQLLDLLDKIPNSSLTIWTGSNGAPLSAASRDYLLETFDPQRLFLDVQMAKGRNCAVGPVEVCKMQ